MNLSTGTRLTADLQRPVGGGLRDFVRLLIGSLFIVVVVALIAPAQANDPRCNRPPYGGSPDRYRAALEAFGQKIEEAAKTLEAICNMKFGGADRMPLYNLGLENAEIDSEDTSLLAIRILKAAKDK
jgi:hypothetical protein